MPSGGADADYTPQEKAALITWHLAQGEGMRTVDVAVLVGIARQNAWALMCRLSRVIPIYQDPDGFWVVCYAQEVPP